METKTCNVCGETKDVEQFYLLRKGGTRRKAKCIACNRVAMRDYMRGRKLTEEEKTRKRLKKYGITLDEYHEMSEAQGHCCSICDKNDPNKLFVDHCHQSGQVRGLLCLNCNSLLGHAKDNSDFLMSAVMYLRSSGTCRSE